MFRKENTNTSLPSEITDDFLKEYFVFKVNPTAPPTTTREQKTNLVNPVFENGVWNQAWVVVEKTQNEIEFEYTHRSKTIRERRNRLLSESDWVVAKAYELNQPVPQEWHDYRQALRDIPNQENFPYEVLFPEIPS
jgi:hypothetical protein